MPNWCDNDVGISMPTEIMKKVEKTITSHFGEFRDGKFHHLHTALQPQRLMTAKEQAQHKGSDWYNWNISFLGTKWMPEIESFDFHYFTHPETKEEIGQFTCWYVSAWSPALGLTDLICRYGRHLISEERQSNPNAYQNYSDDAFAVNHTFLEGGMCFMGYVDKDVRSDISAADVEIYIEPDALTYSGDEDQQLEWIVSILQHEGADESKIDYFYKRDDHKGLVGLMSENGQKFFGEQGGLNEGVACSLFLTSDQGGRGIQQHLSKLPTDALIVDSDTSRDWIYYEN